MKKTDNHTPLVAIIAVALIGGGAFYYKVKTENATQQPTAPTVVVEPIVIEVEPEATVTELPETVIFGSVKTEPFRSGTVMCQWWEDAGMRAVSGLDGRAESTCTGDTCFLLVHDAGMPAYAIMASWLSEASKQGHDPRIDDIELSVFVFKGDEEVDHIAYFPKRDVFESR